MCSKHSLTILLIVKTVNGVSHQTPAAQLNTDQIQRNHVKLN